MPFAIVRYKVADFSKWKQYFETPAAIDRRRNAGVVEKQVLQKLDDPNDVTILFQVSDPTKAKALLASGEVRESLQKAGMQGQPEATLYR